LRRVLLLKGLLSWLPLDTKIPLGDVRALAPKTFSRFQKEKRSSTASALLLSISFKLGVCASFG